MRDREHAERRAGAVELLLHDGPQRQRQLLATMADRMIERRPTGGDEFGPGLLMPRCGAHPTILHHRPRAIHGDVQRGQHAIGKPHRFIKNRDGRLRRGVGKAGQQRAHVGDPGAGLDMRGQQGDMG